ncbi:hypothetical protein NK276_23980, partial [Salmonella enterica]
NVTKIMVDTRQQSSLLYLPLDKIMQQVSAGQGPVGAVPSPAPTAAASSAPAAADTRGRDDLRSRDREGR